MALNVDGGILQIQGDVVSLLTSGITPGARWDLGDIERRLAEAQTLPSNTPELVDAKSRAVAAPRAQKRLARR